MPFKLDTILDLAQYVGRDTYHMILDDKSGYEHLLLSVESRTFFGIQWDGCLLVGRYPLLYTTPLAWWYPISSDQ